MKLKSKYSITLSSFIICAIVMGTYGIVAYRINYEPRLGLSYMFAAVYLLIYFAGFILLVLTFIKSVRIKGTILYNVVGTLNFSLGLIGLILFAFHAVTASFFVTKLLLSFIIGMYILANIYLLKDRVVNPSGQNNLPK